MPYLIKPFGSVIFSLAQYARSFDSCKHFHPSPISADNFGWSHALPGKIWMVWKCSFESNALAYCAREKITQQESFTRCGTESFFPLWTHHSRDLWQISQRKEIEVVKGGGGSGCRGGGQGSYARLAIANSSFSVVQSCANNQVLCPVENHLFFIWKNIFFVREKVFFCVCGAQVAEMSDMGLACFVA